MIERGSFAAQFLHCHAQIDPRPAARGAAIFEAGQRSAPMNPAKAGIASSRAIASSSVPPHCTVCSAIRTSARLKVIQL